jgi:hypothetical protein
MPQIINTKLPMQYFANAEILKSCISAIGRGEGGCVAVTMDTIVVAGVNFETPLQSRSRHSRLAATGSNSWESEQLHMRGDGVKETHCRSRSAEKKYSSSVISHQSSERRFSLSLREGERDGPC